MSTCLNGLYAMTKMQQVANMEEKRIQKFGSVTVIFAKSGDFALGCAYLDCEHSVNILVTEDLLADMNAALDAVLKWEAREA